MAAPANVTLHKNAGRLKDGDEVLTLKVPELDGKFRFEKMIFRVQPSGKPVLVIRTAPDKGDGTPGSFGDEQIKQIEYWGNYTSWANFSAADYLKKMIDAGIFAKDSELTGSYTPTSRFPTNATSQETDYTIDGDGVITRSPKPASSSDVKDAQDKQNALLGSLVGSLSGGNKTTTTGGTGTTTTTQKIVRFVLIGLGVGALVWAGTKLLGKKKK